MQPLYLRIGTIFCFLALSLGLFSPFASAHSRPQRPAPKGEGKKNARPKAKTDEEIKAEEEEKKRLEEEKNAVVEETVLKIETDIVNVDAVVFNKKTGQIISGLKKENFAIFEDGVKQNISS